MASGLAAHPCSSRRFTRMPFRNRTDSTRRACCRTGPSITLSSGSSLRSGARGGISALASGLRHRAGGSWTAGRHGGRHSGPSGTALAQAAWLPVLRRLGMLPWFEGRVLISGASKVFDGNRRVADAATQDRIRTFVEGFATFVEAQRR